MGEGSPSKRRASWIALALAACLAAPLLVLVVDGVARQTSAQHRLLDTDLCFEVSVDWSKLEDACREARLRTRMNIVTRAVHAALDHIPGGAWSLSAILGGVLVRVMATRLLLW